LAFLSTYLPDLRLELRDNVNSIEEQYLGNGTQEAWTVMEPPISSGTVTVIQNGIIVNDYTVTNVYGIIDFDTAPADGDEVKFLYQTTEYEDDFLISYLKRGIVTVESLYSLGYVVTGTGAAAEVAPDPTDDLLRIWLNMTKYLVRWDSVSADVENAFSWRDGDKFIATLPTIMAQRGLLESIRDKIMWDIERLVLEGTLGQKRAGGADPLDYGAYITGTGPTTQDWLWFDGEIGELS
jgi:hypothetical protein